MSYTISKSENVKFIILKATGNYNRKLALNHNLEAHALGKKLEINRYLVDMTECKNVESPTEKYKFAYEDMKTDGIDRTARVALLVTPGDHSHDFIETVSRNAGLDVTLFTNRELAEKHLSAN